MPETYGAVAKAATRIEETRDEILARAAAGLPRPSVRDPDPEVARLGKALSNWKHHQHPRMLDALATIERRFPGYLETNNERNFRLLAERAAGGHPKPSLSAADPGERSLAHVVRNAIRGQSHQTEPFMEDIERRFPGWLGDRLGEDMLALRRRTEAGWPPPDLQSGDEGERALAHRLACHVAKATGNWSDRRTRLLGALLEDHPALKESWVGRAAETTITAAGPPPAALRRVRPGPSAVPAEDGPFALHNPRDVMNATLRQAIQTTDTDRLRQRLAATDAAHAASGEEDRNALQRGLRVLVVEMTRRGLETEARRLAPSLTWHPLERGEDR